jgi:hypothetical protein
MKRCLSLLPVLVLSALTFGVPVMAAELAAPLPSVPDFVIGVARGVLEGVLFAVGPTFTGVAVAWFVDRVLTVIPFARPFRDALIGWVQKVLEDMAHEKAERAVLMAGQQYRNDIQNAEKEGWTLGADELKDMRRTNALEELYRARAARTPHDAQRLIETAVASLKSRGVNP